MACTLPRRLASLPARGLGVVAVEKAKLRVGVRGKHECNHRGRWRAFLLGLGVQAVRLCIFPQENMFSPPFSRKHRHLHSENHRFGCFLSLPGGGGRMICCNGFQSVSWCEQWDPLEADVWEWVAVYEQGVVGPQTRGSVHPATPSPSQTGPERALRIDSPGLGPAVFERTAMIPQLILNNTTKHNHTP